MSTLKLTSFISIFFTGLFTGLMVTFLIVIDRMLATLSAQTYTQIMQELIRSADHPPLVPLMVIISLISPIVFLIAARRQAHTPAFRLTLAGLLCSFVVFLVTVVLNVPINNQISAWSIQAPPADWMEARDRWHLLNIIRVIASALAFGLHLLAAYSLQRPEPETRESR